jgi:hypothetical protein
MKDVIHVWKSSNWIERIVLVIMMLFFVNLMVIALTNCSDFAPIWGTVISGALALEFVSLLFCAFVLPDLMKDLKKKKRV